MLKYTIYIVDDEDTIRNGIAADIEDSYLTYSYANAVGALEKAVEDPPDLVLLDIGLPGMNGIEALKRFKELSSEILVIMITAYEDIGSVIECMKNGAYDYIIKPIHMEALEINIAKALETVRLKKEIESLQQKQIGENLPCFIGESKVICDLMKYIKQVAKSPDTPILILGDTGTGKEIIASTIHYHSPNFQGPFVPVNCAAIPRDLFESELFGYEKGAFSGANVAGKKGLIEMADKGTLFLDEVGELSMEAQAKLLRFMEEGEFYKVGGTARQNITTRIVSATNKDLEKMIEAGSFRKDLFFRLGVISINVPSLNERDEDVSLFAKYFLTVFNDKFGRLITGISDDALELLQTYTWSGNVRELKNMMERAVLTAQGPVLTSTDLGLDKIGRGRITGESSETRFSPLPLAGIDLSEVREALDRHYFTQAIKMAKGNESKAAKLLGLKQHTFRYQYKKLFPDD